MMIADIWIAAPQKINQIPNYMSGSQ